MVGKEVLAPDRIEIPTVSEGVYIRTREALAKTGFKFVVAIEPVSIAQLVVSGATGQRFGYINPSEKMRSNIPPQMEVAIDLNNVRIKHSNDRSTDTQIEMIREQEAALKGRLPEDLRGFISMIMPKHASILAQLDLEHQKRKGKALFTYWFSRTDDQTLPGHVARVGRPDPTVGLFVDDWDRDLGYDHVFAVPVVVLPRKLAA